MTDLKKVLEYLTDLTNNNDREWYHANKERYKQANTEFEHFISDLIIAIGEFDNSIHFAAFKKHIGIYSGDLTQSPFNERLALRNLTLDDFYRDKRNRV